MTFDEFLILYQDAPIIASSTFELACDDAAQLRVQVRHWQRKGYLHALKRGLYVLDERYRKAALSAEFAANYLVAPSYLSLEYALARHLLVPEAAYAYTSITTRKTRRFSNLLGSFTYRTVKQPLFFGYAPVREGGLEYLLAEPEKALLDYVYLNGGALDESPGQLEALRLQNLDRLDLDRLRSYAGRFTHKVRRISERVCELAQAQQGGAP